LYRSTHRLCRAGAPVENLAHSASFHSLDKIAPSNHGIKHLGMSFADIERQIRSDLTRMLAAGGFDPDRDIHAITVNRWSHGYAYAPNSLFHDVEAFDKMQPKLRARIGRIAFANSDTAGEAYAHAAMAEGVRAVHDISA